MEHIVFFPAHDGSPAFRRVAGLEDALRLVEHLRNVEQVEDVSVSALTEVPLVWQAWYRAQQASTVPAQQVAHDDLAFQEPVAAADLHADLQDVWDEAPVAGDAFEPHVVGEPEPAPAGADARLDEPDDVDAALEAELASDPEPDFLDAGLATDDRDEDDRAEDDLDDQGVEAELVPLRSADRGERGDRRPARREAEPARRSRASDRDLGFFVS